MNRIKEFRMEIINKIVFEQPKKISLELIEFNSEPLSYEICIVSKKSMISIGTDREIYLGHHPDFSNNHFPYAPKNLVIGVVSKIGEAVKGIQPQLKIGMRVLIKGEHQAQHKRNVLKDEFYLVPNDLSDNDVLSIHYLTLIIGAFQTIGTISGKSVGIVGLGLLGYIAAQLSISYGAIEIQLHDLNERRSDIIFSDLNSNRIKKSNDERSCDFVLDASGTKSGLEYCLRLSKEQGTVLLIGCHRSSISINPYKSIILPGITLRGIHSKNIQRNNLFKSEQFDLSINAIKKRMVVINNDFIVESSPQDLSKLFVNLIKDPYKYLGIVIDWKY